MATVSSGIVLENEKPCILCGSESNKRWNCYGIIVLCRNCIHDIADGTDMDFSG